MKTITFSFLALLVIFGSYYYGNSERAFDKYRKTNWEKTGYIIKNIPGLELDTWYLIYEEQGAPALNVQLVIDNRTECALDGEKMDCLEANLLNQRAEIKGHDDQGVILVNNLTVLKR